ncbi:MAG: LysR family transcriptional regulator [Hyphomicrobiaceae bacterium]
MLKPAQLLRIDLNLLVLFHVVYEERHVTRAAERLSLTPSAVSHSLGRLRRLLNDPLFLRTPKGVVPSARAVELAEPIADIIVQAGAVIASAEPFDAARSQRRFTIGAPDAISAVLLPHLLAALGKQAPAIDIGLVQLLPQHRGRPTSQVWHQTLTELESRALDLAILPIGEVSPRFASHKLFDETFVVTMRKGHPFASKPSLKRYCSMSHLLVSLTGDAYGVVDEALKQQGLRRRVALTVPSFMMALSTLSQTDLLGTLPRHVVMHCANQFGLETVDLAVLKRRDPVRAVATRAAIMDAGIAWLFALLQEIPWDGDKALRSSRTRR